MIHPLFLAETPPAEPRTHDAKPPPSLARAPQTAVLSDWLLFELAAIKGAFPMDRKPEILDG